MLHWFASETYTTPVVDQWYYTASPAVVNGSVELLLAYSPNYQGPETLQPDIYQEYGIGFFGSLTQYPASNTSAINSLDPQAIPATTLGYDEQNFRHNSADVALYFDSANANGTYTYYVGVVNTSTSTVYTNSAADITVTPVAKTLSDNITAKLARTDPGSSQDHELFEVAGSPSAGTTTGAFEIIGTTDSVIASGTGFSFSDGKAHVFDTSGSFWDINDFGQSVEVWNASTGLADVQFSEINGSTGAITPEITAATELQSITAMNWHSEGGDIIGTVDGSSSGGRGFFTYAVNPSTGAIDDSLATYYNGTVTQDANIKALDSSSGEYIVYWIDSTGLNLELVNSSLQVLETYNIPTANGTATIAPYGDGRILVSYALDNGATSSVDAFTILDTRVTAQSETLGSGVVDYAAAFNDTVTVGSGDDTIVGPAGGSDTVVFSGDRAAFTISYSGSAGNVSTIVTDNSTGVVDTLTNIQSLQFADETISGAYAPADNFTGGTTSDILAWNPTTGNIGDLVMNNGVAEPLQEFAWLNPSSGYQVVGSGDFYGSGTADILVSNPAGQVAQFEMNNNQATWQGIGTYGSGWAVGGTGDFFGNGTDDILIVNQSQGEVGMFAMNKGQASWQGIGSFGSGWAVDGTGDFFGNGTDDILIVNQSEGEVGMFEMNNGQASWQGIGTFGSGWSVAGTGDFYGNGTDDILLVNQSQGLVGMFAMHNGQSTWEGISSFGAGWAVAGTGDYFGNGTSDILLQNASTGGIGTFAMNNGVANWQGIASLPTGWHVS
jgi:hypothetical protein